MIKNTLLTAFLFLSCISTYSQQTSFKIGARVGTVFPIVRVTPLVTSPSEDLNGRIGLTLGLLAEISDHTGVHAFAPEIYYNRVSLKRENTGYAMNIDYISIPLSYRGSVNENLSLFVGPELSFAIATHYNENDVRYNSDIATKEFGFGLLAGLRAMPTEKLFFDLRYGVGLSNILEDLDKKADKLNISVGFFF